MKKLILVLISVLLITPIVGVFNVKEVKAENYGYGCAYGEYEVDYINDDGSFSKKGCYSNFSEAKNSMKSLGGDHVVRHYTSLSPTKIIAMNSGLVYSYPGRSGTNTMSIYQDASTRNIYYKQTYVSNHYEMAYVDTERYLPQYNGGIVQVALNGFVGYADLEYTDLVPSKYLDRGIGLYLGGNNTYDGENAFYVVPKRNYFEAVKNGNYTDLAFHFSRAYPENGNNPKEYTIYIGKAPSFMNVGSKYYSCDGVNFYNDKDYSNFAGTYYNYYQFLPLRSKSDISADTLQSFLQANSSGSVMSGQCGNFISEQNTYGVNGLLLFAMACHESAYGTSKYAKDRNNLFGWNAFDSDPSSASHFSSVALCINEQAGINVRGYIDITDGRFFSSSLGNKGSGMNVKYASDPYWGMKIASIAYKVDKYSKGNNGTYTDLDKYSLSLINTFDIPVKQSENDSSKTLYTTQYGPYYQKDFIVITLSKGEVYTKIQSTNAIDGSGNIKTHKTPITTGTTNPISTYDFDTSVGYVKNSNLTVLNGEAKSSEVKDEPIANCSILSGINSEIIKDNCLQIDGYALIKGMNSTNKDNIVHKINIKNISNDEIAYTYECQTYEDEGFRFNDGHTYKYAGYKVSIPLDEICEGSYYLEINVINKTTMMSKVLSSTSDDYYNISKNINNYNYHLSTNENYAYRIELDVCSLPNEIDYTLINKPTTRPSSFTYDEIKVDDNKNLYLEAESFIYYKDFDDINKIKYTLYLVKDAENFVSNEIGAIKSPLNYTSFYNSDYSLENISFISNTSIKDLQKGYYSIILKIENDDCIDFVELKGINNIENGTYVIGDNSYRLFRSNIRDRIMLEVQ